MSRAVDRQPAASTLKGQIEQPVRVEAKYCFPDDQMAKLPDYGMAQSVLPPGAPLPGKGDVIYLNSTSAWGVAMVIHDWRAPDHLSIEIWLEHLGAARHLRSEAAGLTH